MVLSVGRLLSAGGRQLSLLLYAAARDFPKLERFRTRDMNTDLHLISLWLVDPVGGTFVDWPEEDDDADFTPECWDTHLWQSASIRQCGFSLLSTWTEEKPFWCNNDSLKLLENDCLIAIRKARGIADACNVPHKDLCCYLERLLAATRTAMQTQDAGVCIT